MEHLVPGTIFLTMALKQSEHVSTHLLKALPQTLGGTGQDTQTITLLSEPQLAPSGLWGCQNPNGPFPAILVICCEG